MYPRSVDQGERLVVHMIFHLDTDFILIATILEGQLVAMQFDIKNP